MIVFTIGCCPLNSYITPKLELKIPSRDLVLGRFWGRDPLLKNPPSTSAASQHQCMHLLPRSKLYSPPCLFITCLVDLEKRCG